MTHTHTIILIAVISVEWATIAVHMQLDSMERGRDDCVVFNLQPDDEWE